MTYSEKSLDTFFSDFAGKRGESIGAITKLVVDEWRSGILLGNARCCVVADMLRSKIETDEREYPGKQNDVKNLTKMVQHYRNQITDDEYISVSTDILQRHVGRMKGLSHR